MNVRDLRNLIESLTDDIEFQYQGKWGSICPFNRQNISLCFDDKEITVHSVDDAMKEPFIEGHSLEELGTELNI